MKVEKYKIIKMWKADMYIILNKMYPKIPRMEIEARLDGIIKDRLKRSEIALVDTYREKTLWSDVLDVTQFYFKKKPATAGNGVLFDGTAFNPAIEMLNQFGDRRKAYKKEMKKWDESSFEFLQNNLYQNNEKVKMNAWYGICGAPTSLFFNLECATAITAKGKELISTATCAFEAFVGDNVTFLDMNDCLIFIKNILKESKDRRINDKDVLDYNVSVYDVTTRLIATFDDEATDVDPSVIQQILSNCSQEDLNRIYFKNNLFEFCGQSKIKSMWKYIIENSSGYKNPDPDKTPKELKELLDDMWFYLNEYVFYRYEYVDRVYRVNNKERKVALVIDTDSK